jgi:hypothetical protein
MRSRASKPWMRCVVLRFLALCAIAMPLSAARAQQPQWPCFVGQPAVNSTVPNDALLLDQPTLNCFAWQEFIGLNWPAVSGQRGIPDPNAGPADFGSPGASAPTVWETYKSKTEVFLPGAATPNPWNSPPPAPACSTSAPGVRELLARRGVPVLSVLSAFGDFVLNEAQQASGQWLADQAGNLIYYDIKVNKDEFDSIVANGFYNGTVQSQTAATGVNPTPGGQYQVKLPAGCNAGSCPNNGSAQVGAIEMKAAWRILTDPSQSKRYLTAQAVLVDRVGACTSATMGLVGLHIIHKTASQPQFIWATFEQVDNVPPGSSSTFNNPGCQCEKVIPAGCGVSPTTFQNCSSGQTQGQACSANVAPQTFPPTATCPVYPIQVTRKRPIANNSTDPVVATNAAAQAMLTASNPKTVFQYYQLIDVLWSTSAQDSYSDKPNQPGPTVPLSISGAAPDATALPVANTTMETYVQGTTCLTCHVSATVPASNYASDFSFILGDAQSPTATLATARKARRHLPPGLITFQH